MSRKSRLKLVASAGAALAVAGGGAAVAATQGSPGQESKAIIDDAAEQLGVDSSKLADALEQALANRVDEAVAAGRLTQERGAALKARIRSGEYPLLGLRGRGPRGGHGGHGARLDAAATFLSLTEAELRTELRDGKSLADVARTEGKSVDGLVDALVDAQKAKLAEAVADGHLSDAQRDQRLEDIEERIAEVVNATGPRLRGGRGFGFRGGPHDAPPAGESGYRLGGGTEPPTAA